MKRSAGVSVIAVFSWLGSALTFALGIFMVAAGALGSPRANQFPGSPAAFRVILYLAALVYLLPAVWGLASGVGLWKLKNWARISTIVFSVLLILAGAFGCAGSLLVPLTPTPQADQSILHAVRVGMIAFWSTLIGIGMWWAVFLNRADVKVQFGQFSVGDGAGVQPSAIALSPITGTVQRAGSRPLSITIIAWLLLIGCLFIPMTFFLRTPAIFFTQSLTGSPRILVLLTFAAVQLAIGIGLLRLRPAARLAAIFLLVFGVLNSAVFMFAPGGRTRVSLLMNNQQSIYPWVPAMRSQTGFGMDSTPFFILGSIAGLVCAGIQIYFLITRKSAFESEHSR